MIKEAFGTGATVEDAIESAKAELNAPEGTDVKTEVVELPTKKILGIFGGTPAKARAYYEVSPIQKAVDYIKGILKGMGIENVEADAREEDGDIIIDLNCGDEYGIVIGRRGETLDSIQYLTRLVVNRESENYRRVSINIGDYREKREKTLRSLAHKNASRVAKYGKNVTLEPMNPYERRIIHTAVQDIEGVTSYSIGADADRRVVITLKEGVKPTRPPKQGYGKKGGYKGGKKGSGHGGYKGRRDDRNNVTPTESRPPRTDAGAANVSLYGKLN